MTRVLTVDDSRAIRSIVSKQVAGMGLEVDEAEHGVEGLEKLVAGGVDLVVLDVTMPELDGPGMLRAMRERGDKTPVLMLTSESKRSIIADCMKLGIEDYIVKPFKPEELTLKISRVLNLQAPKAGSGGVNPAAAPAAPAVEEGAEAAGRQFMDVLLVDDMENVHKKLRSLLPAHITMQGCPGAQAALTAVRQRIFRVVLIDTDIPDVNSVALMGQLRMLQPHAAFVALSLRSTNPVDQEVRKQGFDDLLYKPFDPTNLEDFLLRYFDKQELLSVEDNLLKVGGFTGRAEHQERYFRRIKESLLEGLDKVAAACYEDAIVDLTQVPTRNDQVVRLVIDLEKQAGRAGLTLRLVGTPETAAVLRQIADTGGIPYYASVSEARAAAA
ncbi:MAG: response regulator [Deltaproteobacteria bacterium]|nr:response regulator [Deltaproteobacteria bacterium]